MSPLYEIYLGFQHLLHTYSIAFGAILYIKFLVRQSDAMLSKMQLDQIVSISILYYFTDKKENTMRRFAPCCARSAPAIYSIWTPN